MKRKNKINTEEMSGTYSQPVDLSATFGEPHLSSISKSNAITCWSLKLNEIKALHLKRRIFLPTDLYRKAIMALKERQDQGQRAWILLESWDLSVRMLSTALDTGTLHQFKDEEVISLTLFDLIPEPWEWNCKFKCVVKGGSA